MNDGNFTVPFCPIYGQPGVFQAQRLDDTTVIIDAVHDTFKVTHDVRDRRKLIVIYGRLIEGGMPRKASVLETIIGEPLATGVEHARKASGWTIKVLERAVPQKIVFHYACYVLLYPEKARGMFFRVHNELSLTPCPTLITSVPTPNGVHVTFTSLDD